MHQKKINEELFEEANKLRNMARESVENYKYYFTASEKFQLLADYYYRLLINLKNIHSYSNLEIETQKKIINANRNHVMYEKEICLFMYRSFIKDYSVAEEHLNNSENHIELAIKELKSIKSNIKNEHEFNYDIKNWTYHKNEINFYRYSMLSSKLCNEKKYGEALDNIRQAIIEIKNNIETINDYIDVIGIEYIRITKSNMFAMMSNQYAIITKAIVKNFKSSHTSITEGLLIEALKMLWNSYNSSLEALKENPLWDGYSEVMKNQTEWLKYILKNNLDTWEKIYIHFEEDKEFLCLMKEINVEKYTKIYYKLTTSNNKLFKTWLSASYFVLLFVVIVISVTFITTTILAWWKLILAFIFIETILICLGAFTLRLTGDLSESKFIDLINIAVSSQLKITNSLHKKANDNKKKA